MESFLPFHLMWVLRLNSGCSAFVASLVTTEPSHDHGLLFNSILSFCSTAVLPLVTGTYQGPKLSGSVYVC